MFLSGITGHGELVAEENIFIVLARIAIIQNKSMCFRVLCDREKRGVGYLGDQSKGLDTMGSMPV